MLRYGLRTSGSELEHSIWAARGGSLQRAGMAPAARGEAKRAGEDCGKDAPWKSPSDFPTSLGNPAQTAGFPLSHSHDGGTLSTSYRTYRVLKKADILTCYRHEWTQNVLIPSRVQGASWGKKRLNVD